MAKISEKHKLFCKALLKHKFNQTKAYQEVYPNAKHDTAKSKACHLVTKDNVQEYLSILSNKQDDDDLVTIEEVITGLKQDIEDARLNGQYSVSVKARELLGKYKAMWTDKVKVDTTINDKEPIKIEFE